MAPWAPACSGGCAPRGAFWLTHTLHLFPCWTRGAQRARVTQCPQEFQQFPIYQVVVCMSGSRKGREEEDRETRAEGDHTVSRAFQAETSPIAPPLLEIQGLISRSLDARHGN